MMKSKYIGLFSATAVGLLSAVAVLGGVASISSAASGGPTVTLTTTSSANTSSTTIPITATFSEDVNSFSSEDVTASNATVGAVSGSGTTFTFSLTPTSEGEVTVMLPADISSSTASSTGSQQSNTLVFNYTPENTATTTEPVITNVMVTNIGAQAATITWTTDVDSGSRVRYGTTTDYGTITPATASSTMSHSVTLTDLEENTLYHFRARSDNSAGATQSADMTFTTLADATSTLPVISNVMVNSIGSNSATITWSTDVDATSQVRYGTTTEYGLNTEVTATSTMSHSVTLTDLMENTMYHFKIKSTTSAGATTSSDMNFTTLTTSSSTPLSVNGIDTVRGNAIADGTFQNGWEWILRFTVPDTETNFAMKFSDFMTTSSSSTIPVANNVRIWTMQSSNASTTESARVETNNNYSSNIVLNGDASTTTPGRQVDLHIQVAVPLGTPVGTYTTTFGAMSTTTAF